MKSTLIALLIAFCSAPLMGASEDRCAPEPAAPCNQDECCKTYCMGPNTVGINAPLNPRTCNGDFIFSASALYWQPCQTGLVYAIKSEVQETLANERANLIDAEFLNPSFEWDFGFKFGLGYNSNCDGWDLFLEWTHYTSSSSSVDEAREDENITLLPLWSAFSRAGPALPQSAFLINTYFKLKLDLVDLELGRAYWNSQRLSLRPHIGIRYLNAREQFDLVHRGGYWAFSQMMVTSLPALTNEVELHNDFHGVGLRAGLDSSWNFGCGVALYGKAAIAGIRGKFLVEHDEKNRLVESPFTKFPITDIRDSFHQSLFNLDLALGLSYSVELCDCKYGFFASLGWEEHTFFSMNQLWRITPKIGEAQTDRAFEYTQVEGNLSTNGLTLTLQWNY